MFRKLCKYEFKSMARTLAPIYLAVIAVSLVNALMLGASFSGGYIQSAVFGSFWSRLVGVLHGVSLFVYFGVMVALGVLTLIVIIQRFYKGLLSDEGYLMFTLPVKPWQLIAAKGTAAFVMSLASGLTALVSILILAVGAAGPADLIRTLTSPYLWSQIGHILSAYPAWPVFVLELIVLIIVSGLAQLYHLYCSMAIGHLTSKHRIALSLAAYVAMSMVLSIVSSLFMLLLGNPALGNLQHLINGMLSAASTSQVIHLALLGLTAVSMLELALFFFGTERILTRRLNLE